MAWGMPEGFAELIRRKYDIMQQGADAESMRSRESSNLDMVRAGLMPAAQKSEIAKQAADTAGILESNKYIGDLARSGIALQGAQAYGARTGGQLNLAQVGNVNAETVGVNQINKLSPWDRFRTTMGLPNIDEMQKDGSRRKLGLTGYTIGR